MKLISRRVSWSCVVITRWTNLLFLIPSTKITNYSNSGSWMRLILLWSSEDDYWFDNCMKMVELFSRFVMHLAAEWSKIVMSKMQKEAERSAYLSCKSHCCWISRGLMLSSCCQWKNNLWVDISQGNSMGMDGSTVFINTFFPVGEGIWEELSLQNQTWKLGTSCELVRNPWRKIN